MTDHDANVLPFPSPRPDQPDPAKLRAGLQAVADELGVPLAAVMQTPWPEINRAMIRVHTRAHRGIWDAAREVLIAERMMALLDPFPDDTTIEDAIAAGLVSEEEAERAMNPTQEEIEAALGPTVDY